MGHQIIGLYSQNTTNDKALIKIPNHNNKEKTHDIKIKPNTILYKIFGPTLTVNSRHNEALSKVNYPFKVSAVSKDNVIEGIEYVDDNHFVLGVQFHPEDLDNTENLYNYFLKEVLKRKK
jgi:putative glutamine amidotransferase